MTNPSFEATNVKPDFTRYSLALLAGKDLIYSSAGTGLRPLWEALEKHQSKTGLTLHDKVIGLAAARLIARSGIVVDIFAMVASLPAKEFLEECGIRLSAFDDVAHILTQDKSAICPGELIALETPDPDNFVRKIQAMLHQANPVQIGNAPRNGPRF
jgi:hypothetical protein